MNEIYSLDQITITLPEQIPITLNETKEFCFINNGHLINKNTLKTYITSWLQEVERESFVDAKGESWTRIYGFMRKFYYHDVYQNNKTGKYGFHVYKYSFEIDLTNADNFPNFGVYKSLKKLVNGVVDIYAKGGGIKN